MEFKDVLRNDRKEQLSRQRKVFTNEGPLVPRKEIASSYRFSLTFSENASSDLVNFSDLINDDFVKKITRHFFGRHFRS